MQTFLAHSYSKIHRIDCMKIPFCNVCDLISARIKTIEKWHKSHTHTHSHRIAWDKLQLSRNALEKNRWRHIHAYTDSNNYYEVWTRFRLDRNPVQVQRVCVCVRQKTNRQRDMNTPFNLLILAIIWRLQQKLHEWIL